jgi:hypothetical protein
MRVACLIQGDKWVALNNLFAPQGGASSIAAELADQNFSPEIGNASLVVDGEEFAAHVVSHSESRIVLEADGEIEKKLSSSLRTGEDGPRKTSIHARESSSDFDNTSSSK